MSYSDRKDISVLVGKTISAIQNDVDRLYFAMREGPDYVMYHSQDCCERVYIDDIVGDLEDLIDTPVLLAAEVSEEAPEKGHEYGSEGYKYEDDSFTWTFYRIATIKGTVVVKWYGSSNGYYSESVDFEEVTA